MKNQHTPGQWHVEGNGKTRESDVEPRHVRILSPHVNSHGPIEKQIAVVYYGETDAEREANARLIAAAPDLLEALQDASYPGGLSEEMFKRWLPLARAAIAKAIQP